MSSDRQPTPHPRARGHLETIESVAAFMGEPARPEWLTDPAADYSVLLRVRERAEEDLLEEFGKYLSYGWSSNRTHLKYAGEGGREDHRFDYEQNLEMGIFYEPGDYSRALYYALRQVTEARRMARARAAGVVLVCGDRNWPNDPPHREVIRAALDRFAREALIVHGDNGYEDEEGNLVRGADRVAADVAREMSFTNIVAYPVEEWEWRSYGKKAGPIRNVTMFQKEKPDVVLAFHDNLEESRGTKHMVEFARRKRTPVELYNSEGRVTE